MVATRRRDLMWHGGAILDLAPVKKGKERCLALSVSTGTFTEFSRLCEEALEWVPGPRLYHVVRFPKEGGEIFVDSLVMPKGAPSPELAKEFMRFMLQQSSALAQVKHLFFSPVVELKGYPGVEALAGNAAIFPSDDVLRKFEMMVENPARDEAIQMLWTELKTQ